MWADDPYDLNSPLSDAPGKLENSHVITGQLRVYGFSVYSSLASAQNIQMFDATSVPADSAIALLNFPIAASSSLGVWFGDCGRIFRRGLVLCNSTTDTSKTIGAVNCYFDVQYDFLGGYLGGQGDTGE